MPKFDLKILKVLSIIIVAILIILFIVIAYYTSAPKEKKEKILDALNNGESVVYYKDNIYSATKIWQNGKMTNALLRTPIDSESNESTEILTTFATSLDDIKLWFFENKLFYDYSKVYIYDFDKRKSDMFCEGELQFMLEPNAFVMLQNGNIYKCTYYPSTYMAKTIEQVAIGDFIRIGEDDDKVYYYSTSGTSNTIIVALDKESLRMITLDNINTRKQTVEKVVSTDDYIYAFISGDTQYIKQISKKLNKNETADTKKIEIEKFDEIEVIDSKYTKTLNLGSNQKKKDRFNDIYFYSKVILVEGAKFGSSTEYETKLYKYSAKENKVEEYTGGFNELYLGSYSAVANGSFAELYYGDRKITEIETGYSNLNNVAVTDINIIQIGDENYLFYEIRVDNMNTEDGTSKDADVILARTLFEGGKSVRINK